MLQQLHAGLDDPHHQATSAAHQLTLAAAGPVSAINYQQNKITPI